MKEKKKEKIQIPEVITVGELAGKIGMPVSKVIAELMKNGVMATINEYIDFETAAIIAEYLGFELEKEAVQEKKLSKMKENTDIGQNFIQRPPVVAVMGHVDHGKTSLLDAIRESSIVKKESGGITQHIGAYQVERSGRIITFLDTPGHAAFEKMREHGAQLTDIALIVIAADDGVKPQTVEAVNHAKKAETPMIVVITKIDKPDADITRAKQQASELGLTPEEWGGDTLTVEISSKTKEGIEELLDLILVATDLKEFKADPVSPATGVVIETHLDYGKGPVATVLIKNGTLRVGDYISVGESFGKVRSMEDFLGKKQKEALPSTPVKISGLKNLPELAAILQVFESEKEAKIESEKVQKNSGIHQLSKIKKIGLEELSHSMDLRERKELNIVLKADVKGSLDAISQSFSKFKNDEVSIKIVSSGVGPVSENDVSMAKSSGNIIFAFNVTTSSQVDALATREKVKIFSYKVIYELLDDIKNLLSELLPPEIKNITLAKLEVLKIFARGKGKMIVGGKVKEGKLEKNTDIRVIRQEKEVGLARITLVKREKDEIKEAQVGTECGVSIDRELDILEGDIIESFRTEEIKRTI